MRPTFCNPIRSRNQASLSWERPCVSTKLFFFCATEHTDCVLLPTAKHSRCRNAIFLHRGENCTRVSAIEAQNSTQQWWYPRNTLRLLGRLRLNACAGGTTAYRADRADTHENVEWVQPRSRLTAPITHQVNRQERTPREALAVNAPTLTCSTIA